MKAPPSDAARPAPDDAPRAEGGATQGMPEGVREPLDCADMAALRRSIDALDRHLIALFGLRQRHIARAAALKPGEGLPARIPERVEAVAAQVRRAAAAEGLDADLYESLWRRIIEAAIAFEDEAMEQPPRAGRPAG